MKAQKLFLAAVFASSILLFSSCDKHKFKDIFPRHSDTPTSKAPHQLYPLSSVSDSNIAGTVKFQKASKNTLVTIQLQGTTPGNSYPAHIHYNSAAQGGGIAISLTPVKGNSGHSATLVKTLDDGTPISYDSLLNFNGYVNVHLSSTQLNVIVAQGDIGSNF